MVSNTVKSGTQVDIGPGGLRVRFEAKHVEEAVVAISFEQSAPAATYLIHVSPAEARALAAALIDYAWSAEHGGEQQS
jgi:hypothetical protein